MSYAWIIDKDHLAEGPDDHSAAGVMGPREAPDELCAVLNGNKPLPADAVIYRFSMYDDDGIRYVTGRMITDEGQTEDACYAPLGDYGAGGMGCVLVKYRGHPEMDCG
jgi:hypothetical protein